ncbi:MAG: Fe-S protein assembly co-chaperone HscB [SAR324 cluster bacterium]|nr:Fe-S protein assembly co-chaperone HscB [SAR324 cluster bacterium]
MDFFEVLGFPVSFEIKSEELELRYQDLSLELHPDFYGSASEEEKLLSETATAILNSAYKTLREPTLRADYILHLLAEKQKLDERSLPEGFLAKMFFLQETLDELLDSGNAVKLSGMRKDLQKKKRDIEADFAPLFRKYENNPEDTVIPQQLQTQLNAERYLRRLIERIPATD